MSDHTISVDLYEPVKLQSWVWKHAQLSPSYPNYVWSCVPGRKPSTRRVSRKDGTTTNFRHHPKHAHGIKEGTYTSTPNTIEKYTQARTACSPIFAASMDSLITQFFITNCLPFNVASSPSYTSLFQSATGGSYDPPRVNSPSRSSTATCSSASIRSPISCSSTCCIDRTRARC